LRSLSGTPAWAGPVVLNTDSSIGVDAATLAISGAISGPASLTKVGGGTLTLANPADSYRGNTAINPGTLHPRASEVIPDPSSVTVAAGAVFDLHGFSESIDALNGGGTVTNNLAMPATLTVGANGGSGTFAGTLQDGSGPLGGVLALTKIGNGTQTLSGNSTYTGLTAINKGAIIIQSNTAPAPTPPRTPLPNRPPPQPQ